MTRDLADLERLHEPAGDLFTNEVITALRVGLARIEGKLDQTLTLRRDVERLAGEGEAMRTRITKLEEFNRFQTAVGVTLVGLLTVLTGAGFTYLLTHPWS